MTTFELIKTPDGTVWWCVNRVIRYAIPGSRQLATYQAHLENLGLPNRIVDKSHDDIKAYGMPVFDNQIARVAAAVDGVISDEDILAAGSGGGGSVDVAPVLEQLKRLPADVIAALKATL